MAATSKKVNAKSKVSAAKKTATQSKKTKSTESKSKAATKLVQPKSKPDTSKLVQSKAKSASSKTNPLKAKSAPSKSTQPKVKIPSESTLPIAEPVQELWNDSSDQPALEDEIKVWAESAIESDTIHEKDDLAPLEHRPALLSSRNKRAPGDSHSVALSQSRKVDVEIVDEVAPQKARNSEAEYSHLPTQVTDGLTLYLNEIRKYPLLSREDELELAKKYFEFHDPKDAERLVTANLRFVVKVAAEYAKFGSRLVDLIQEGNVGLMHAVKEFNPYKGVRLITYAVWWIRGYIQEYLMRQYSMVRIGTTQNQRKLFYRLEKERERLVHEGQDVTPKLLSDRLGVTEDEVNDMQQRLSGRDLSLDQPLDTESSARWIDFEHSDEQTDLTDQLAQQQALKLLNSAIGDLRSDLNAKEIKLLDERLLADEPKKLQEIGDEWGVSREAVRQMEARLMKKIKTHFEEMGEAMPHD